jgi:uncharacterized membrane protein
MMQGVYAVFVEILRARLWVIPSLAAVVAAVAAFAVLLLDPGQEDGLFATDADSVRAVLSAISGAMITFTALVFSITMLVLQLAASQLSPRVMRTFLRDRSTQAVMGLFVAAFVFALLILLDVDDDRVSRVGVIVAVGLVLAAVLAFVAYIDHMAHAIRPVSVIRSIGAETRDAIDRAYPREDGQGEVAERLRRPAWATETAKPGPDLVLRWSGASGYIQAFDDEALVALAMRLGHDLDVRRGVGSFLVRGTGLVAVRETAADTVQASEDLDAIVLVGRERTMSQDPEFGFRQLVDIALRALSPSLNDPTTAVQVIDELHALLQDLRDRPVASPWRSLGDGDRVVRIPVPDWDAFVHAATEEIAPAARAHTSVLERLGAMLEELERGSPPARLPALRRAGRSARRLATDA